MADIYPGYVGFSRSNGTMGKLIRFGESISGGRGEVNHMFVVDNVRDGIGVIQAEMKGVTRGEKMTGEYLIVKPPKDVSLTRTLKFARAQVGIEYGLWTDIGIGIDMVTWQWVPAFRGARKESWICSALGAESLRYGGWLRHFIDIYTVTPQQALDALIADGAQIVLDTIHT